MKLPSMLLCCLMLLSIDQVFAQKKFVPNGYYISKAGDTVYGYLRNKESMYLVVKMENGKRKQFTPSKIQGFNIAGKEYIPLFLREFDTKRFMVVRVKGYCSLYAYEDVDKYSTYGMMGLVGGAIEGSFKAHNSGLYIKKDKDENYYSVPSTNRLIRKFLNEHFGENTSLIESLGEDKISEDSIENFVITYNTWYKYKEKQE